MNRSIQQQAIGRPIDLALSQLWLEKVMPALLPAECSFGIQRYDSQDGTFPLLDDLSIQNAIEKRRWEFSAGRAAAQIALKKLGIQAAPIPVAHGRNPLWPAGLTGSITHTAGLAVAVTARKETIRAVGIDLEISNAVKADLWTSVLTPNEIDRISVHPAEEQAALATLFFCVKETFYKLQYPLTGQWVDFHEAEVVIREKANEFTLTCSQPKVTSILGGREYSGRYAIGSEFTITAMHLAAPPVKIPRASSGALDKASFNP